MHPFEFALAIVALIFGFKLLRTWMLQRQPSRAEEAVTRELRERLVQLEERVSVLERIVTDERFDLKQQFKDLEA
jgi:hypothetical protein